MVLRLASQILENASLPVALHVVPIFHLPVAHRVVYAVCFLLQRLIPDVEVEVVDSAFLCERRRFVIATHSDYRRYNVAAQRGHNMVCEGRGAGGEPIRGAPDDSTFVKQRVCFTNKLKL